MSEATKYWKKPPSPHTLVKTEIVLKYFAAWSRVLRTNASELLYLDLYAGKGQHSNGEYSTPVRLLELASEDEFLRKNLNVLLNDVKPTYCKKLSKLIDELGFNELLHNKPRVNNARIDEPIASRMAIVKMIPTFCFIDPYGYKGLSQTLVRAVIKDWGSDCLVFLHTSGINRNMVRRDDMALLFGKKRLTKLLGRLERPSAKPLPAIVESFCSAAGDNGARFSVALQFNFPKSHRVSHHLVFLSKSRLGFRIMKDVMAGFSLKQEGIPRYVYIEGLNDTAEQLFFQPAGPMHVLKARICKMIGKRVISVGQILNEVDDKGLVYTTQNVKTALKLLVNGGRLCTQHPQGKAIRPGTMPDQVLVSDTRSGCDAMEN